MRNIRVYPLFFMFVLALILIPSSPVHASTIPIYVGSVVKDCSTPTSSCVAPSINTNAGDRIMVTAVCWSFTPVVSDSLTTVFTTAASISGAFPFVFTGVSSGGADVVSLTGTCNSVLGEHLSVDIYRFVTGIGVTNTASSTQSCTPCPDSLTMIIQPNSFIYEVYAISNGGSTCAVISGSSGQSIRDTFSCDAIGGTRAVSSTMDRQYTNGGSTTSTATTGAMSGSSSLGHITVELLASGGSVTQVSACLGNCGTPAVTRANTNSTKGINFNISQTWFYENQATFPALIINETASVTCNYGTAQCPNANSLSIGVWVTQTTCFGAIPFTVTCPGNLVASGTSSNPTKGLFTIPVNFPVFTGQWVAIGFSATASAMQLNDTNTSVSIFNNPSRTPAILNSATSQGTSKANVYAWVTGNTITGGGIIPTPVGNGQCGTDFVCWELQSVLGLTPNNPFLGALFFAFIYSIFSTFILAFISVKTHVGFPGGIYLFTWVGWFTFFPSLVGAVWFVILEILVVALMFTVFFSQLAQGTYRQGQGKSDS